MRQQDPNWPESVLAVMLDFVSRALLISGVESS